MYSRTHLHYNETISQLASITESQEDGEKEERHGKRRDHVNGASDAPRRIRCPVCRVGSPSAPWRPACCHGHAVAAAELAPRAKRGRRGARKGRFEFLSARCFGRVSVVFWWCCGCLVSKNFGLDTPLGEPHNGLALRCIEADHRRLDF